MLIVNASEFDSDDGNDNHHQQQQHHDDGDESDDAKHDDSRGAGAREREWTIRIGGASNAGSGAGAGGGGGGDEDRQWMEPDSLFDNLYVVACSVLEVRARQQASTAFVVSGGRGGARARPEEPCTVLGDGSPLSHVMMNLLFSRASPVWLSW